MVLVLALGHYVPPFFQVLVHCTCVTNIIGIVDHAVEVLLSHSSARVAACERRCGCSARFVHGHFEHYTAHRSGLRGVVVLGGGEPFVQRARLVGVAAEEKRVFLNRERLALHFKDCLMGRLSTYVSMHEMQDSLQPTHRRVQSLHNSPEWPGQLALQRFGPSGQGILLQTNIRLSPPVCCDRPGLQTVIYADGVDKVTTGNKVSKQSQSS